jgi:hypothetical protein
MLMAIELLLKEERGIERGNVSELIDERSSWDDFEKKTAHWVREKRNDVTHQGRFPNEQEQVVIPQLHRALELIGDLWKALAVSLEREFSGYECSRLEGRSPNWQDESDVISLAACEYWSLDAKIAFDMADHAFTIALRAYARSCGIRGAEALEPRKLIRRMEELDDDDIHPSLFLDWLRPEYQFQTFGGDDIEWFVPPMDINKVVASSSGKWDVHRAAQNYTRLIRDVVLSYPLFLPGAKFGPQPNNQDFPWS